MFSEIQVFLRTFTGQGTMLISASTERPQHISGMLTFQQESNGVKSMDVLSNNYMILLLLVTNELLLNSLGSA